MGGFMNTSGNVNRLGGFNSHRRGIRVILALCLSSFALTAVGSVISESVASAATTTLYASPTGSGSTCSSGSPCSLSGAQTKVESLNSDMTGNIVVQLSSGTYRLSSTWDFTGTDSAANGYTVTWEAASGATPVITGGEQVTGWTEIDDSDNLWEASLPEGVNTRDLWVNGTRANLSEGGTLPSGTTQTSTGYDVPGDALQELSDPTALEFVLQGAGWVQDECGVSSVSGSDSETTVTMDEPCYQEGYDVPFAPVGLPTQTLNAEEYLNGPNQFAINTSTNKIYFIPAAGENMSTADAEVGAIPTLVQFNGTSGSPVTGVDFSGITFQDTTLGNTAGMAEMQADIEFPNLECSEDWNNDSFVTPTGGASEDGSPWGSCAVAMAAAVEVHAGRSVEFAGDTFQDLGTSGITFDGGTQDSSISGDSFDDVGGNAVQVGSVTNPNQSNSNLIDSSDTVSDNFINNVADEYQGGVGVWTGYTRDVTIEYNDIENADYTGISTGWGWGSEDTLPSIDTGNEVLDNYITNTNIVEEDGGGIYNLGPQPDGVISGNYVLNPTSGASNYGMYLDEGSTGWSVDNNVVINDDSGISWAFNNANSWDDCSTITFDDDVANPIGAAGDNGINSECPSSQTVTGLSTNANTTAASATIDGAGLQGSYQYLAGLQRNGDPFQTYSTGANANASFSQSEGTYTINTAGSDVWGATNQFGAIYVPSGAGSTSSTTVEVDSQVDSSAWAKAGLMMNDSIPGTGTSLGYAILAVYPGNGVTLQWDDDSSGDLNDSDGVSGVSAPIWLRMTRSGTSLTGYYSTNDSTWTSVGTLTLTGSDATEDVGMFADSQTESALGGATFSNFSVSNNPFSTYSSTTSSIVNSNNGSYTIDAEGSDVWEGTNQFGAVYDPSGASSTSSTTVEVDSQDDTSTYAKAGLMLSDSIPGAGTSLGYAILAVYPGNGITFQWDGDSSGQLNELTGVSGVSAPVWLRLTRTSTSSVTAYYSTNGTSWTSIATENLTGADSTEDVGMFADSQDSGVVNQSTFSNFAITNSGFAPFASTSAALIQSGGTTTINAEGTDVWQSTDDYGAVYEPSSANSTSTTTVEVNSQVDSGTYAKAGLMLRDNIQGAGSALGYCTLIVYPSAGADGVSFQWDNNSSGGLDDNVDVGSLAAPIWLRLTRTSTSSVTAYYSTNGTTWTTIGTETLTGADATEDVGMFADSEDPGVMGGATFSNFSITG